MPKLVRITTVPISLLVLLKGQMRFMQSKGFDVTMISSDGEEVAPLLIQEDCPHISIELTRKITPIKDLLSLIALTRLLLKIKPDIVHTHTPKAGLIGMWAAKFAGVPVRLHTIAGLPWVETTGMMRKLLKNVEKLTAMAACQILPNSFVQRDFLYNENIARGKMKVIGGGSSNGIDSDHFSSNETIEAKAKALTTAANLHADGWIWIFVGRIVKDKGMAELMESFVEVHAQFPKDRLWLVGEEEPTLDPLEEKHRTLLHEHPAIKWCGYQKDIRPYLAAAKVLAFPSYREGFPNVPLQAGSMGCMLLLSDINGCNEIVKNGTDGMLVPPKNTAALTTAMLQIRNNPTQRDFFASAIQQKIKAQYNQKLLWNLLLQEYQQQLNIHSKKSS